MTPRYLPFAYAPQSWQRSHQLVCSKELEYIMRGDPDHDRRLSKYLRRDVKAIQKIRAGRIIQLTEKLAGKCCACGGSGRISSPMGETWCAECY
jgi:hypothetical protein